MFYSFSRKNLKCNFDSTSKSIQGTVKWFIHGAENGKSMGKLKMAILLLC